MAPRASERRPWIIIGVVVVMGAAVAIFFASSGGSRRFDGQQVEGPEVAIADPASRPWSQLVPVSGARRDGFPIPMLAMSDELCFGFGRADFADPTRPSLARCVDRAGLDALGRTELRPMIAVKAGLDDWWVIEFGESVDELDVGFVGGGRLSPDRVHLDGSVAVIRLPTEPLVSGVTWRSGPLRIGCEVAEPASGRFCDDERPASG